MKEVVDSFLETEGVAHSDKIWMFLQLVKEETLMEQLRHHDFCLQMEMSAPDPIYDFAYGILRLAKPHLFPDAPENKE